MDDSPEKNDAHLDAPPSGKRRARRAAAGAYVGTSIEFYDFFVFATASALVFGDVFFSTVENPFLGTMAAFATFGVGFVFRPLGGLIFGPLGDKYGRKPILITTLLIMGGATFAVGLVPSYDSWGIFAPLTLVFLRLIQGLAIGGEWGGAATISTESAPSNRRYFYGSFTQLGSPTGTVLSSGMFALAAMGGDEVLQAWAWRVPFLFAGVLLIVSLIIRARLEESPEFEKHVDKSAPKKATTSLIDTLKNNWRSILAGSAATAVGVGGFYITGTLFLSYATTTVGLSDGPLLTAQTIAAATSFISFPLLSLVADRKGPRVVIMWSLVAVAAAATPHFLIADTGSFSLIAMMLSITQTAQAGAWACIPALLRKMFDPEVRYTGMSISYQLSSVVFGGLMPMVGAGLLAVTGGSPALAIVLLVVLVAINIIGVLASLSIIRNRDAANVPNSSLHVKPTIGE